MIRLTILCALLFVLSVQLSWGEIPETISYQGLLTTSGGASVAEGNYNLMFVLYDSETNGSAIWTETHFGVPVTDGVFNVILGSATSLNNVEFDQQYWLGVTLGAGPEMIPRTKLTASPYSLNSRSVADGAVTEDKIAANAVTSGKIDNSAVTTVHILNGTIAAEDVGFNYAGSTSPAGPATDLVSSGAVDTADLADDTVTGSKIADGQVVRSINGKTDDVTLAEGTNITITPSGNTLTISSTDTTGDDWKLTGNAGTGGSFLGTTDDAPLELRVNNSRALRLEPHGFSPNVIGGFSGNNVTSGVFGATISGGGTSGYINSVTAGYGTVGGGVTNTASSGATVSGGKNNQASGNYSTVGGGNENIASGIDATVSGGQNNEASGGWATISGGAHSTASSSSATVGGGSSNEASGGWATIGGGYINIASGNSATVPGGYGNIAQGNYSFAAGHQARANANGCFVWADDAGWGTFSCNTNNRFDVRCTGGAKFVTGRYGGTLYMYYGVKLNSGASAWSSLSDRNAKENFAPADGRDILRRLASLPLESWNYKSQAPSIRHIGPMAQDFYAAFGVGADDKHITTIDADGVALAAIQGLYELVEEKDAQISDQQQQISALGTRLAALEELLSSQNKASGLME